MPPRLSAPIHSDLTMQCQSQSDQGRTEWLTSADRVQLDRWDEFLLNSPRGHYCQLSTWLRSFEAYGFRFAVLIARAASSGPIVGGIGVVEFGNRVLRLIAAPIGP